MNPAYQPDDRQYTVKRWDIKLKTPNFTSEMSALCFSPHEFFGYARDTGRFMVRPNDPSLIFSVSEQSSGASVILEKVGFEKMSLGIEDGKGNRRSYETSSIGLIDTIQVCDLMNSNLTWATARAYKWAAKGQHYSHSLSLNGSTHWDCTRHEMAYQIEAKITKRALDRLSIECTLNIESDSQAKIEPILIEQAGNGWLISGSNDDPMPYKAAASAAVARLVNGITSREMMFLLME